MTSAESVVLAALADPIRRRLIDLLTLDGACTASALSKHLDITRQGVAKHLRVLAGAGLVRECRTGREVRFEVDVTQVRAAAGWLANRADEWDRQLTALKRAAEAGRDHD